MRIDLLLRLLDAILLLIPRGIALFSRIEAVREEIEAMNAVGREPTDAEWEATGQRTDDRLERLRAKVRP